MLMLCAGAAGIAHGEQPGSPSAKPRSTPVRHPSIPLKDRPIPVSVSFAEGSEPAPAVPRNFLGLSFEVGSLARIASYAGEGDLVTLLRSLGVGVLRFGGVTADEQIGGADRATPRPAWALRRAGSGRPRQLGSLAADSGWHVLLTLGLGHLRTRGGGARGGGGEGGAGGIARGDRGRQRAELLRRARLCAPPRGHSLQYDEQVAVLSRRDRSVRAGHPARRPGHVGLERIRKLGVGRGDLPAARAADRDTTTRSAATNAPRRSIARLLSPQIRQLEEVSLRRYTLRSRSESEVPFRLDETNTVSCGGVPGISNTFASALWAVSYLTQAMDHGRRGDQPAGQPRPTASATRRCARRRAKISPTGALVARAGVVRAAARKGA